MTDALVRGLTAEGFKVTVSQRGDDGFDLAQATRFDLIILDLMLPGMNGFKFCLRLRELGNDTPVLVLTAKQGELDEAEALDSGADDYLTKPFSFIVLLAHVRALLRRKAGVDGQDRAGDLVIDSSAHRCWRGDVEIDLSSREFRILECFFSRVGETLTRRELLDEAWDWATPDNSNLVEVYIGYLRRKIDVPFGRSAIQTVRGVGYRLDPDGG